MCISIYDMVYIEDSSFRACFRTPEHVLLCEHAKDLLLFDSTRLSQRSAGGGGALLQYERGSSFDTLGGRTTGHHER